MALDRKQIEDIIREEILKYLVSPRHASPSKVPDILIILTNQPDKQIVDISGVQEVMRRFCCLCFFPPCCNDNLSAPFDMAHNEAGAAADTDTIWQGAKAIVLFQPSLPFLAGIITGAGNDEVSMRLMQALVSGKPVLGIECGTVIQSFAPESGNPREGLIAATAARAKEGFEALYRQYVRTLGGWGVEWIKPEDLYRFVERLACGESAAEKSLNASAAKQRLIITGDDVMQRIRQGEKNMPLPPDAIITDVAREIAEKHGFKMGSS